MFARRSAPRRGGTLVWLALCLTGIVGVLALGLDGGRMMEERRRAQTAADAAALAAAKQGYDQVRQAPAQAPAASAIVQAGIDSAATNGYTSNGTVNVS